MTRSSRGRKQKQKQKQGDANGQSPSVAEATRIRISRILEDFRASDDDVYTFEANLSNRERAEVHTLCRKMGMVSKSSGRGTQRRVSVFKTKKNTATMKRKEDVTVVTFSKKSKDVLLDFFMRYPPGEGVREANPSQHGENTKRKLVRMDSIFCKPLMDKAEIANKVESLASRVQSIPAMKETTELRSKLPITSFKDVITSTVENHQVVLISGETGCGKTTQVPQFLLDHMWGKGEACKIVCTQPRRLSAVSVSERISYERGENVGESVGYKIRLESKGGKHSSIVFCTNGILLRVLVSRGSAGFKAGASRKLSKRDIGDFTHIVVDEIHERDRFSDLMLAILRDSLSAYAHLRLVLMSATVDAERFSQYFGGCPIIRVPGFTYPVKTYYLEDVFSFLKASDKSCRDANSFPCELTPDDTAVLDEAITLASSSDEFDPLLELISSEGTSKVLNYQHSVTGVTPLMVFSGKGRTGDLCMLLSLGADCHLKARDGSTALDWAEGEKQVEAVEILKTHMENAASLSIQEKQQVDKYLSSTNPELVDVVLIEQLLRKICADSTDGAILVFLPGWDDINRTRESLLTNPIFKDCSKFLILALHSMIPSFEQKKVFRRPPQGCRKIILSTNIAETAVTIDDVVYVIDSGRMKEKSYDPYNNVSTLQSSWISRASARQREGRAGRCQPGVCYHLYSKVRAESLPKFQVPEIRRMPIEELCLQVKILDPHCKIEEFLQKTLDPPVSETIRNAIFVLQDVGALSLDEKLTELGEKLGSLPVHPLTSKMLFLAILMNCLDPALTLACAADYRDPFTLPMLPNEKNKAAAAKAELASLYGGKGDQLAVIAAFDCWRSAKEKGQEARFCSQFYVSPSTMNMLFGMRKQLQNELLQNGYIRDDASSCSLNARDPGILHGVLLAGLYPMIGKLHPPYKSGRRFTVETANGDKVRLHPHSTNFRLSYKSSDVRPLFMYDEITRGDGGMHIRNCTIVGPLPLLFLATEIAVAARKDEEDYGGESDEAEEDDDDDSDEGESEKCTQQPGDGIMSSPNNIVGVTVDRWLSFESTALEVAQIYCLRERLSEAILFKAMHPRLELPPDLAASTQVIACLLSYDGLSGISLSSESGDSSTSMVNGTGVGKSAGWEKKRGETHKSFLKSLIKHGGGAHKNTPLLSNINNNLGEVYESQGARNRNHPPLSQLVQTSSMLVNPTLRPVTVIGGPSLPILLHSGVVEPSGPTPRQVLVARPTTQRPYGPSGGASKRRRGSKYGGK
ncbi:hypothetical protein Dimus_017010 [Dionaea muscipula]